MTYVYIVCITMQVLNLQGNRVFGHSDNAPGATRQNSLSLMVSDVRRSASGSDLRKSTPSAPAQVSKLSTTIDQDNITPKDQEPSNSVRFFNATFNLLCICSELSKILSGCEQFHLRGQQGRIYVANEYPTVARTMLIVCQKPKICV